MFTSICFCVNKYYIFPYIPANTDSSQVLNQHTNNSSTFSDHYDNNQVSDNSEKQQQQELPVMSPELDSESLKQSKLKRERKSFENTSTGTYIRTYVHTNT